jgi:hypothetical protein
MSDHKITAADLRAARISFETNESRDLFYRAATELVSLALRGGTSPTSLSLAEALAVLLQTWNRANYRYRKFDKEHFAEIERLLLNHQVALTEYRDRTIDNLNDTEQVTISTLFQSFERVLGPVGAAKALHLIAPRFFPLWDRAIAKVYVRTLGMAGSNGKRYWRFMSVAKQQWVELSCDEPDSKNLLKSIDEYNYCKHTKGWLS